MTIQPSIRRTAIRAGLVGLLVAATLGYVSLEKRVVVRVEGQIVPVKTFATTVGDALDRAGIPVNRQDSVSPPLSSPLADGESIRIVRAKPITILLNGKPRRVVVTALTVDDVLRQIELRESMHDYVGASRSARVFPGMTLIYRQAVALTVVHDDQNERIITNAASVRRMLAELKIQLGAKDKVRPGLDVYPVNGMTVKVLRVGERREVVQKSIDSPTITRSMRTLEYGTRRTVQQGSAGLKVFQYQSTYVDGVRVKRKLLQAKVVRKPRPTIIGVGAGFPRCGCHTGSQSGKASWYDAYGLTAAHPTLPFGTVVQVTNLANGKSVTVVIRDRGPFVAGRVIDMSRNAFGRIARASTGVIKVKLRW